MLWITLSLQRLIECIFLYAYVFKFCLISNTVDIDILINLGRAPIFCFFFLGCAGLIAVQTFPLVSEEEGLRFPVVMSGFVVASIAGLLLIRHQ